MTHSFDICGEIINQEKTKRNNLAKSGEAQTRTSLDEEKHVLLVVQPQRRRDHRRVSPRGRGTVTVQSQSVLATAMLSSKFKLLSPCYTSAVCTRRCKFYSAFFVSICIMRLEHCEVVQSGQFPVQNTCSRIRNIRDRAAEFYVFTHCPMLTCLVIRSDYFRYRWTSTTST